MAIVLLIACFLYGLFMRIADEICAECYEIEGDTHCNSCIANPGRGSEWIITGVKLYSVSLMADGSLSASYRIEEVR